MAQQLCPRLPCIDGVQSREDSPKIWLLGLFFRVADLVTLLVDVNLQKMYLLITWFYSTEGPNLLPCIGNLGEMGNLG